MPGGAGEPVPEQRLHRRPAEEVRVHNLVAVAAQQELARLLQRRQHQRQLNGCQVLYLVDDDQIEADVGQGRGVVAPRVRNQVGVEQAGFVEPLTVAAEQRVRSRPVLRRQQTLSRAECAVAGQV